MDKRHYNIALKKINLGELVKKQSCFMHISHPSRTPLSLNESLESERLETSTSTVSFGPAK